MSSNDAFNLAWAGIGATYNGASNDTTFATADGQSLTKSEISANMAPYAYVGNGSKGSPNCPKLNYIYPHAGDKTRLHTLDRNPVATMRFFPNFGGQ
ncbi:hypothetical protein [Pedobacter aquatilis]|uniref:hypothetical protein n=1 Tax=Pedobacter aquatilis TaxID=351343 RepID=UPI00292E8D4C|nr:hypothetical protein [Pedobacter aquatilis]